MNPLSTLTFYRRHKRHAAMLLSLSIVVTLGLYSMIALMSGVLVEPGRLAYMAYSKFGLVTPQSTGSSPCHRQSKEVRLKNSQRDRPHFIVGLALVIVAALMFLLTDYSTAGIIAIGVLGLISIATSRRGNR